ncbi:MAG: alpha-L-rhamnosidase N-terminal domain-containing protein [Treponema sp.]|nr:alpha-L-rhamnosidase N-terminal domain-containing protein [Treponema sp.]
MADAKGKNQTAARIAVSCNEDMSDTFYDTGFAATIDGAGYEADIHLSPRTRYYWTVTVKSDAGEEAASGVNWFETGKMDEPWQAQWIDCDSAEPRHPVFFKTLSADCLSGGKPVKRARLYICGLGLYEASINGKKIGGREISSAEIATAGKASGIRIIPEKTMIKADGQSLCFAVVEIVDDRGRRVPFDDRKAKAVVSGVATLAAFGNGRPVMEENYTTGEFTSYLGHFLPIVRAGYEKGEAVLKVSIDGLGEAEKVFNAV